MTGEVNADRVSRLTAPLLRVVARMTHRVYFWYVDETGRRHLWWGRLP